jgi:hypothetical protein
VEDSIQKVPMESAEITTMRDQLNIVINRHLEISQGLRSPQLNFDEEANHFDKLSQVSPAQAPAHAM